MKDGRGLAAFVACLVFPACSPALTGERAAVEMTELNKFEPTTVTVARGAVVVWRNGSSTAHTATFDPLNTGELQTDHAAELEPWNSGILHPEATWSRTFRSPGTYLYRCGFHGSEEMLGIVEVH